MVFMALILEIIRALIGVVALLAFCYWLSNDRKGINWRLVFGGLGLQAAIALLVLKTPYVGDGLGLIAQFAVNLLGFSLQGSQFVFGELATDSSYEAVFAFRVMPSIVFFSALTSILYYLGILQKVVYAFAWVMQKTMKLSGAESLAVAANVFIGQTEAPLMVKPYLERMTRSEITCLMAGGMATSAGAIFAAYVSILAGDDAALQVVVGKRLISAFIMAAPAAVVCAKILLPEHEEVETDLRVSTESMGVNIFDAVAGGVTQGVKLSVNVGAVVLVFVALVAMLNDLTGWVGGVSGLNSVIKEATDGGFESLTLQFILGVIFMPVAWLIGVDVDSLLQVGVLLGEKLILNDLVAYTTMAEMVSQGNLLTEKAVVISTFVLCGFASFVSVGVQIGGISVLAPGQRTNLAQLGIRAMIGAFCASLMSANLAGLLIG